MFFPPSIDDYVELLNRHLAKLGSDGFSLVSFRTKVSDSKEFYKKSNKDLALLEELSVTQYNRTDPDAYGRLSYHSPLSSLIRSVQRVTCQHHKEQQQKQR